MGKTTLTGRVLIAQREDGQFLRLDKGRHPTGFGFVDDPLIAEHIILLGDGVDDDDFLNPKEAPYYFENSKRARDIWLKGCKMVAYQIIKTTEISAIKIRKEHEKTNG